MNSVETIGNAAAMKTFILVHDEARRRALAAVAEAPAGMCVEVKEPKRTDKQNDAQWPILRAFSEQLMWPVNGKLCKLTPEEWKDVLSAAFYGETVRLAMGLDGGVVMLGQHTSQFDKKPFSEWLDFLKAAAALRGIHLRGQQHGLD